jgi:methionyl-tRNA synthetase
MSRRTRQILVTSALPYANGSIHIGHLVEYIQTDIWVRFQKLCGHDVTYVCGDDAHGTPIMLAAQKNGVSPEEHIARYHAEHKADFAKFGVAFDNYYTTHSELNKTLSYDIYEKVKAAGMLTRRPIEQFYDPEVKRFLPDRYIKGTCPNCKSPDQYGDSCEVCGKHYDPKELIDPRSAISGATPITKESDHIFIQLEGKRADLLRLLDSGFVDPAVRNKLQEWFKDELRDWDITRDEPFFGFAIPGEQGKYLYNWFDAPIGYLASLGNKLGLNVADTLAYWNNAEMEVYHFIGVDIQYFHALFWPAMLMGASLRVPTKLAIHGFLTVNGEKMSKSRGTFINASVYAKHMDPQWLRYYYATKLTAAPENVDLSMDDFVARVNSELVGKLANLISRAAPILSRNLDGKLGVPALDAVGLLEEARAAATGIGEAYEGRNFAVATRQICALADKANKYVEDQAPWALVKKDAEAARGVLTAALEMGRILTIYLKPILPEFAARVERCLAIPALEWKHVQDSMVPHVIAPFERLADRIDPKQVEAVIEESKESLKGSGQLPVASGQKPEGGSQKPEAGSQKAGEAGGEPVAATCTIDQFMAVDLRVGLVLTAEALTASDKLMKIELDAGPLGKRTILAGIKQAYTPERLVGRHVIFCANLAPRKMKFGTSEGMILASGPGGAEVFVLSPDAGAQPGQRVH